MQTSNIRVAVIIMGGGLGKRYNSCSSVPKQYKGFPSMIQKSISAFDDLVSCTDSKIISLIKLEHFSLYRSKVKNHINHILLPCGNSRFESIKIALNRLSQMDFDFVLVHDGCRPFLSSDLIWRVINALESNECIVPVCSINDTVCYVEVDQISSYIPRKNLFYVQTPQGFHFNAMRKIYNKTEVENFDIFTDESSVMFNGGSIINFVKGEISNIKITHSTDSDIF